MEEKDLQEMIDALDSYNQECCSSPERATQALIEEGILTSSGEIAEPYRSLELR